MNGEPKRIPTLNSLSVKYDSMKADRNEWRSEAMKANAEIERLKARNDLLEKGLQELWNVGHLRTYVRSEADVQNPDAWYIDFDFDDSIMDVETFVQLWKEKSTTPWHSRSGSPVNAKEAPEP